MLAYRQIEFPWCCIGDFYEILTQQEKVGLRIMVKSGGKRINVTKSGLVCGRWSVLDKKKGYMHSCLTCLPAKWDHSKRKDRVLMLSKMGVLEIRIGLDVF